MARRRRRGVRWRRETLCKTPGYLEARDLREQGGEGGHISGRKNPRGSSAGREFRVRCEARKVGNRRIEAGLLQRSAMRCACTLLAVVQRETKPESPTTILVNYPRGLPTTPQNRKEQKKQSSSYECRRSFPRRGGRCASAQVTRSQTWGSSGARRGILQVVTGLEIWGVFAVGGAGALSS
jgi:hypothetical protein